MLVGPGCCACRGGSDVIVYTSMSPLGPYTLVGSVGKNTTAPFDPASPYNYVTRAQQTKVVSVPDGSGNKTQYLWIGNAWVTSPGPLPGGVGGPRDQDLLYFSVLEFTTGGIIQQMRREEECQLDVPWE